MLAKLTPGSIRSRIAGISAAVLVLAVTPLTAWAAPSGSPEPSYAGGTVVYMSFPAGGLGQSLGHSTAVATHAYDLYLAVYPVAADGFDATPKLINGWYAPQCDPCFHFGVPDPFGIQFHDHILDGAPGYGIDGTAGSFSSPWRVKLLFYDMSYIAAHAATWTPVKSDDDIAAAVAAGEFLGPPIDTGVVVLCPVTSARAH